jgi:biopolymer transport protein ExbD
MKIPVGPTKKARIEIIPMIDAIFFLLVFFMFSSLSMVKMKGVGVALPTTNADAASAKSPAAPLSGTKGIAGQSATGAIGQPKLVVTVDASGRYFLNKSASSAGALPSALQSGLAARPDSVVIVNIAPTQNTQQLISVMDAIGRVSAPKGHPLQVLIATEKVDANGVAIDKAMPAKKS